MKKEALQLLEPARKPGERGGPCRAAAGQRVSTECCVTVARLPRLVDLVNSPKRPEVGATQLSSLRVRAQEGRLLHQMTALVPCRRSVFVEKQQQLRDEVKQLLAQAERRPRLDAACSGTCRLLHDGL